MSRSNPTDFAENPAKRFFDWAGGEGRLVYYDREQKTNIEVDIPFRFLILDEVATVGGGYDYDGDFIGYWSNAIRPRDAKVSPLTVRSSSNGKSRVEHVGTWADIKAHLTGAKYIKGLYIAFFENDELRLGYLKIRGASMKPWIDLINEHKDIYNGAFSITNKKEAKKGTNVYFEPVFKFTDKVKDETNEAAFGLDRDVLQPYLAAYFSQQGTALPEHTGNGHQDEPTYEPSIEDEPVYDDEVPF